MHDADPEAINALTKPEIGYEYRDVDAPGILKWTVGFFVGTTVSIALTLLGFWLAIGIPVREDVPITTIPGGANPLLQGNMAAKADIAALRQEELKRKQSSGWIDETKDIAHIPIDRAMEILAERGVNSTGPKRDAAPAAGGGTRL